MLERKFQADLIYEIRKRFDGCYILKNDANYIQGFPDLLILYGEKWAGLEVKQSATAPLRPNQKWYIEKLDMMGYCALVYPENRDDILHDLDDYFWRP